ncbi:MAG TPA: hypothetical protein VJQ45_10955 [Ktedonobacterales bacterium]|nr:hypothetical protein [Ktedonobacterales bacterium]
MLPPLRPDGTLPPGIHSATLAELLAAHPPVNEQRQVLNDSVRRAVEELFRLDPLLVILVDGSYVTRKAEPNDVDILIISTRYTEPKLIAYLDQVCPVEAVSLDINVEPQIPNRLLDLFTLTHTGQAKGIARVVRQA